MSRENLELVRSLYDAVGRHDPAAVIDHYDPAVTWDMSRTYADVMGQGVYRGHEGLRQWFREWQEAWEMFEYPCQELVDAGEHVVSVVRPRARGRASGLEVHWDELAGVWTIRGGRVVQVVWYPTREQALSAAGTPYSSS